MTTGIICSGFGGQGVLTTGLLLANAFHQQGKNITWYPSYGSEMRGGTANCMVKESDEEIPSPYVKEIDVLITLNEPAIIKFEKQVVPGGYLFVNASLVPEDRQYRDDIHVVKVDTASLAKQAENPKGENIVMIGAVLKKTGLISLEDYEASMHKYFSDGGKGRFNDANSAALRLGFDSV